MAGNNTKRVGIYLPVELKEWFDVESKETGAKANSLMIIAFEEYRASKVLLKNGEPKKFKEDVRKIIADYLEECGII